jgi:anti-sigma B factor antagonist
MHPQPPVPGCLQAAVEPDGQRGHVRLAGDLDLATAPALRAAIARADHAPDHTVTVDLAALTFCDCAGLGVLITDHHTLRAAGGGLILIHPPRPVRRLLALTGTDRELAILGDTCPDDNPIPVRT